jgi:hypothetical protein
MCKTQHCFGNFVTLVRVCLTQYNRLDYIVNAAQITVRKAQIRQKTPLDLFSSGNCKKDFEQLLLIF